MSWLRCAARYVKPKPLTEAEAIAHNEKILKASFHFPHPWMNLSYEDSRRLIEHPTIECSFSRDLGTGPTLSYQRHGHRKAVWLSDMHWPRCSSCFIENPYE